MILELLPVSFLLHPDRGLATLEARCSDPMLETWRCAAAAPVASPRTCRRTLQDRGHHDALEIATVFTCWAASPSPARSTWHWSNQSARRRVSVPASYCPSRHHRDGDPNRGTPARLIGSTTVIGTGRVAATSGCQAAGGRPRRGYEWVQGGYERRPGLADARRPLAA